MFTIKPFITELLINITISPMIINFTTWTRLNCKLWATFTRVLESSREIPGWIYIYIEFWTWRKPEQNMIYIVVEWYTISFKLYFLRSHVRPCFYCCWYFYNGPLLHFCEHKSDFCLHFPDYAAMIKHCCFTS